MLWCQAERLQLDCVRVQQRSLDLEHFCHETATRLCADADKKFWFCNDYDVEVFVCPFCIWCHSSPILSLNISLSFSISLSLSLCIYLYLKFLSPSSFSRSIFIKFSSLQGLPFYSIACYLFRLWMLTLRLATWWCWPSSSSRPQ